MPRICIDAGHFAKYNWNPATTPTYWESLMAWDLHLMLKEELEKYDGVEVVITRQDETKDLAVYKRGQAARGCDLFISLHSNAGTKPYNETVDRAVVIYPISEKELDLARALAQCITETMELKDNWQTYLRWNSSKNADYYGVIRGAASVGVPGLILEHSFHTNNTSAIWLMDKDNLRKLAVAEAKVIAARYGCKRKETEQNEAPSDGKLYRVQVGAFTRLDYAEAFLAEVQRKYPNAYIRKE